MKKVWFITMASRCIKEEFMGIRKQHREYDKFALNDVLFLPLFLSPFEFNQFLLLIL